MQHHDTEQLANSPESLLDTCEREVDSLIASVGDKSHHEIEAQLREIARAISRLESSGVAVPDMLRSEKTRLTAELETKREKLALLAELTVRFRNLADRLAQELGGAPVGNPNNGNQRKPRTDDATLRRMIVEILKAKGGMARSRDVSKALGQTLEGAMLEGDQVWRKGVKQYAWQQNAHLERNRMVQEVVLRSDSRKGYWELTEEYR